MHISEASSDRDLLIASRAGDTAAFSVLWSRHHRPALVAARSITSRVDPQDVVAEAYLRIFELVSAGKGPTGAFRPYLYRVVRSVAVDWLRNPESSSAPLEEHLALTEAGPWAEGDFDRGAAAQAFQSLNPRWQEVLWYTEVEGIPPREVAKLLGTDARSVSAMALRAREELRSAWVEAHVNRELIQGACELTLTHLQRYQRGKLTAGLRRDVEAHLGHCVKCTNAAEQYSVLNRHLALVLATIFLGGVSAASLLNAFGRAPAATATALSDSDAQVDTHHNIKLSSVKATIGSSAVKQIALIAAASVAVATMIGGATVAMSSSPKIPIEAGGVESTPVDPADERADNTEENPDQTIDDESDATEHDDVLDLGLVPLMVPLEVTLSIEEPGVSGSATPDTAKPDEIGFPDPEEESSENAGDNPDTPLSIGFECSNISDQEYKLTGTASGYGVLKARISQPPSSEVLLIAFPPIIDEHGNAFENFFSITAPMPNPVWETPSLTPLEQWPGLQAGNVEDVLIEMQLVTPDGQSPWVSVDPSQEC